MPEVPPLQHHVASMLSVFQSTTTEDVDNDIEFSGETTAEHRKVYL